MQQAGGEALIDREAEVRREERRELRTMLVLGVLFAIACVFLGRWQYHRFQAKYAADHLVGRNYRSAPVAVGALLPSAQSPLAHRDEWRSVRVTGVYDAAHQVLVRNRPFGGAYGYEVLAPLRPSSGGPALLVDRGWIPSGQTADAPDSVPPVPSGTVTVVAHLRPGEPAKSGGSLPPGQFESIDLGRIQAATADQLYAAYGVLAAERPAGANPPALLPEPDDGGYWGVNLSYAFQWALFGIAALALPFVFVRRRRRLRAEDAAALAAAQVGDDPRDDPRDEPPSAGGGAPAAAGPARAKSKKVRSTKARAKKVRIWDEEDE